MESAIKSLEQTTAFYLKDLRALTEDQILNSAGGRARKVVDFTYEAAFINSQIAAGLAGRERPASPEGDEWMEAPAELRTKDAICKYFEETSSMLLEAARGVPEENASNMVGPEGRQRSAFAWAQFAAMHTMYHDAQINFVQSLNGDLEMHWF